MFLADVFNSEVINYECEADQSRIMYLETRLLITLVVAMLFEPFLEIFWAIIPACGKPFIMQTHLTYTNPFLSTFSRIL